MVKAASLLLLAASILTTRDFDCPNARVFPSASHRLLAYCYASCQVMAGSAYTASVQASSPGAMADKRIDMASTSDSRRNAESER